MASEPLRVVRQPEEEARERRHHLVIPEKLALGLLYEPEGLAAKSIEALGVPLDSAREALVAALPPASVDEPVSGRIPFTRGAKKVVELAVREALKLGHNYIGTEHLLLGVLEDEIVAGTGTLSGLGITRERLGPELKRLVEAKREAASG
jgi:ATP-dependent Clp protease ATP-binding subunit ClpA